jgi:hypothetical protein
MDSVAGMGSGRVRRGRDVAWVCDVVGAGENELATG